MAGATMMITAGFTAIVFRSRRLDVVIPPMSLRQFLLAAADRGDQPAVIDGLTGRVTSYGQFAAWWIGSPRGWPHMIWQVITRRSSARGARPSGSQPLPAPPARRRRPRPGLGDRRPACHRTRPADSALRPDRLACLLLRRRPRTVPVHDGGTSMISEIVRAAALRTADGGNGRSLAESIGRDR